MASSGEKSNCFRAERDLGSVDTDLCRCLGLLAGLRFVFGLSSELYPKPFLGLGNGLSSYDEEVLLCLLRLPTFRGDGKEPTRAGFSNQATQVPLLGDGKGFSSGESSGLSFLGGGTDLSS